MRGRPAGGKLTIMAGKRVGPDGEDGVEQVLDELYATPPSDFVPRREQAALAARSDGRAADARRIRAARRPTQAAWAANLLLRARPQESRRFLELGQALREAYRTLDADGVKELSEQRRSIVSALSRQAAELAREAGHRLSDATRQDVDSTLRAVLADQDAADRWAAGRLESALTPPADFPARSAGTPAGGRTERARAEAPRPSSRKKDELAERRRRRQEQLDAARRAAEEAGRLLRELRAARADAVSTLQRARERHDLAEQRRSTAEEELRRAGEELERADRERREAEEGLRAAGDAVERAERTARHTEKEAARLAGPAD
ncbi:Sec-independent protein translocase protein TatA [Streptomyces achromogenes]|nr:Sec-independent protein translocase protein TatA [Streptomyces achromogenes]